MRTNRYDEGSSCIRLTSQKVQGGDVFQWYNVYTKFRVNQPVGSKVEREATHTDIQHADLTKPSFFSLKEIN